MITEFYDPQLLTYLQQDILHRADFHALELTGARI
jgi:hypothetical protein